jgi:hypothetical protein
MRTTVVASATCHNCGASLQGRFCAICGQEDEPLDPTVGEVAGEFAREISDLDGRILGSVQRLFLSPGFLTMEHFEGRRIGWVSPVRLYLIFSVAYFGITSLTGATPFNVNLTFTGSDEDLRQAVQRIGFSSQEEMRQAVNQALTTWVPRAMFILVPVFGWLLSRVRRRAGRKYPHHLIVALHLFAAFFGVQALAVGIGYVAGNNVVGRVLGLAGLLYGFTYMVAALRVVYGGTIVRAAAHTIVVLVFYWLATMIAAASIIAPLFLWKR